LSNAKHRELINEVAGELPQGQNQEMLEILKMNQEIKDKLEKL
jgi:hypothetical protein